MIQKEVKKPSPPHSTHSNTNCHPMLTLTTNVERKEKKEERRMKNMKNNNGKERSSSSVRE